MRTGMTSGESPGTNEVTVASVPLGLLAAWMRDEEADDQQERQSA